MKKNIDVKKTVYVIAAINFIQIAALIIVALYFALYKRRLYNNEYVVIIIIIVTTFLNSIISIRDSYYLYQTEQQKRFLEDTLAKVEDLNFILREQRHDFLNHLQVVHGLIEMDEYIEAKNYIEKTYADIQKVSSFLKTSNPAVNALLQAKILYAQKKGISVNLHVSSRLERLPMPGWELCRVLGNIIDNAIEALEYVNSDKIISIEISENIKSYNFKIYDNGIGIPPNIQKKIFERGFTTKGNNGQGIGLSIAKEIILKHKGHIDFISNAEGTIFEFSIPRMESCDE
ncbi:MAG TPA: GHKL domain-containing protein [Clostridiaceae bacterium]|nr:GHKL domain-containing protein [Clostridiaceae bacterium]